MAPPLPPITMSKEYQKMLSICWPFEQKAICGDYNGNSTSFLSFFLVLALSSLLNVCSAATEMEYIKVGFIQVGWYKRKKQLGVGNRYLKLFIALNVDFLSFSTLFLQMLFIPPNSIACVWIPKMKPETVSKMSVNQKLLCFGTMFASQVGEYCRRFQLGQLCITYEGMQGSYLLMRNILFYPRIVVGCCRFLA